MKTFTDNSKKGVYGLLALCLFCIIGFAACDSTPPTEKPPAPCPTNIVVAATATPKPVPPSPTNTPKPVAPTPVTTVPIAPSPVPSGVPTSISTVPAPAPTK